MPSPYVVGGAVLAGAVIGGTVTYFADKELQSALSQSKWMLVTMGALAGAGAGALIGSEGKVLSYGWSDIKAMF